MEKILESWKIDDSSDYIDLYAYAKLLSYIERYDEAMPILDKLIICYPKFFSCYY